MFKYIYLSIDPGTSSLGTAINGITHDNKWVILDAHTTNINLVVRHRYPYELVDTHSERYFKVKACGEVIYKIASAWGVNGVVSESPYMGRFPQAFAALTECMLSMRNAAYDFNPNRAMFTIDPSTIKKAVGVSGKSGDKNLMRNAVNGLVIDMGINTDILDEHAIDAIAVGYTYYRSVLTHTLMGMQ